MKSSYKPISELVERIDIRNSDGDAAILMGLSMDLQNTYIILSPMQPMLVLQVHP